jgi:hypothetical protein
MRRMGTDTSTASNERRRVCTRFLNHEDTKSTKKNDTRTWKWVPSGALKKRIHQTKKFLASQGPFLFRPGTV